jgi:hypothetical protein
MRPIQTGVDMQIGLAAQVVGVATQIVVDTPTLVAKLGRGVWTYPHPSSIGGTASMKIGYSGDLDTQNWEVFL